MTQEINAKIEKLADSFVKESRLTDNDITKEDAIFRSYKGGYIKALKEYKLAWERLKGYVLTLQEEHEKDFAYSNQYLDDVENEISIIEEKYLI